MIGTNIYACVLDIADGKVAFEDVERIEMGISPLSYKELDVFKTVWLQAGWRRNERTEEIFRHLIVAQKLDWRPHSYSHIWARWWFANEDELRQQYYQNQEYNRASRAYAMANNGTWMGSGASVNTVTYTVNGNATDGTMTNNIYTTGGTT